MSIKGKVIKYAQDNIDTDVIIPGQYLKIHDYAELAAHAMEGLDPDFHSKVQEDTNYFVLAGKNFGCGSSREHAPIALSHSKVKAVLAPSFARIFYRNSVDGAFLLPIEIGMDAYNEIQDGDQIQVDVSNSTIHNTTRNKSYDMVPFSGIIHDIINAGGLFEYGRLQKQG